MAIPKRKVEYDATSSRAPSRVPGPVLVSDDESPPTATKTVLSPPPRVPPGATAANVLPDPAPGPEDLTKWLFPPSSFEPAPYFTFQAPAVAIIVVVLIFVVVAGLLA